ncbi:unnamed protein product [Cuscuta campestris]|uniref:Uncharacterized protein n=1 Tax=Cuscuta campestris TaxID=132261 RepID=A0A484LS37_9ASTE|nr:unnamed protein product [Cuscuta campestris]
MEAEEFIQSSSFQRANVRPSVHPLANPGPTYETGSSSSQACRKRVRNSTPPQGSRESADVAIGTAGDKPPTTQDTTFADLPYPYARESHLFTGYTAWGGRDFQHRLFEMDQFRKDHPDVLESPAWPFMLEEYTRMDVEDMKLAREVSVWQCLERERLIREEGALHRRQAEEELERRWCQESEEASRKATEEAEQRWRLHFEEVERQLCRQVEELNLALTKERRSAYSSLEEALHSLETKRFTYEGHMARIEAERISKNGRGFYMAGCRGSRDREEEQIRNFICNSGENPSLKDGIKLEAFIIIVRERDDGAVEITTEIEPSSKKKKQTTPLFVVLLREAELYRYMEFDVGDSESQIWRF